MKRKRLIVALIISMIVVTMSFISCSGEPKYTYEEYKKIKAIDDNRNSKPAVDKELEESNSDQDELQSYFEDLNNYNLYMQEFSSLYDKYFEELIVLIDGFDNETEDLEKKNQHASSIRELEGMWIAELEEVDVPDFIKVYHDYFIEFLNNDLSFYNYFLEEDLEKANNASSVSDDFYEKSLTELETIEKSFNDRAESLNLEIPF